ncbi:MAG: hypothetical protein LBG28_00640 [Tannerella sp.]|jgi:hypothetical protein|nr:hypothetical protein [Tannerella sp.]
MNLRILLECIPAVLLTDGGMSGEIPVYLGITLALAAALFIFGLLFHALCRHAQSSVYRKALRMMIFTYCFFGTLHTATALPSAFPQLQPTCPLPILPPLRHGRAGSRRCGGEG